MWQFTEIAEWFEDKRAQSDAISIGHPTGLEYACHEHIAAAQALVSRSAAEAQTELRAHFGAPPAAPSSRHERTSWWQRLFGR